MPTRYRLISSIVAWGSQLPVSLNAFSPASVSTQVTRRVPPDAFATAASNTRRDARQMSRPVPSPSMKGMIGSLGTTYLPSWYAIGVPCSGPGIVELPVVVARLRGESSEGSRETSLGSMQT